jgi:NAD(P)-dependent dehydrogenase (short-subunit alcohol dehydrogenase family)
MKRLENKVAVIYGAGAIGNAAAKAFEEAGAKVFLAGHSTVDALDEEAVEAHIAMVIAEAGRVDISFNAIGLPQKGIQGIPLTELSLAQFSLPIATYTQAHFLTAKAAAKRMMEQGNGVIMMHTPNAGKISPPYVGGMVPAWAAIEGLCRSLSVECGPKGVNAVCLMTTGIPETPLIDEVWDIHGKSHGITFEQFHGVMEGMTHRGRLTSLRELTDTAIFIASGEGSAMTGTIVNLTAGMII